MTEPTRPTPDPTPADISIAHEFLAELDAGMWRDGDALAPPLTDAAETIAALAGIVKQRDAEIDHLRDAIWRLTAAAVVTA